MTKLTSIDGLPVLDARKPIILEVTAGDCKGGNPKQPSTCAVARALAREFKSSDVKVHLSRVYVKTAAKAWTRYTVPKSMRTEIVAFDRGGAFAPGEYYLSAPKPSVRLGKKRTTKRRATGTHPQRGHRAKRHVVVDVRGGPAAHS